MPVDRRMSSLAVLLRQFAGKAFGGIRQGGLLVTENPDSASIVYNIEIEIDEDGRYIAECVDLPGCVSDGATEDEALDNIADAIRGYLASMAKYA